MYFSTRIKLFFTAAMPAINFGYLSTAQLFARLASARRAAQVLGATAARGAGSDSSSLLCVVSVDGTFSA